MEMLDAMGVPCGVLHGASMGNTDVPYPEKIEKNVVAIRELLGKASHTKIKLCI